MSQYVTEIVDFIKYIQETESGKPFEKPEGVLLAAKELGEKAATMFGAEAADEEPTVAEILDRVDSSALPYNPRRKTVELDRYIPAKNLALACLALESGDSSIYRGAAIHHPHTIECIEAVLSTRV